jgi:hypothetical protein
VAFSQKRALKEGRTIVFADQSGFYLLPMVVRTYAPVGKTPILKENLTRDHLSAMSGITLEGKLYMLEQERAFKAEDAVRFLKHLKCVELKNLCCESLSELKVELRKAKERLRHKREVILGCIRQPGFGV